MDLSDAARLIEAVLDFRLLRRVPAPCAWPLPRATGKTQRGVSSTPRRRASTKTS
jgi:hypothetical protein